MARRASTKQGQRRDGACQARTRAGFTAPDATTHEKDRIGTWRGRRIAHIHSVKQMSHVFPTTLSRPS
ncbi:hypothetical protein AA0243_2269 [Novacetimonas hansenii NRIC 0243]|nr:hypothetical protein AA0243_2269 [Novacetimonas hansenii NRIC 0243]